MRSRSLFILCLILAFPAVRAQDARSLGMGGCGTATINDAFSAYWNPAAFAYRENAAGKVFVQPGFSIVDTTNLDSAILDFNGKDAYASASDPIVRSTHTQGILAGQYRNYGGAVLVEDSNDLWTNRSSLGFVLDRLAGLPAGQAYDLNRTESHTRLQHLILGTGRTIPMGAAFQHVAVGANIKYTLGSLFDRRAFAGPFTQGTGGAVDAVHYDSDRGRGLSYDLGVIARLGSGFLGGVMWENIKSKMKWEGTRETIALDPASGLENPSTPADWEWDTALPRNLRIGMVLIPEGKDIILAAESRHADHKTWWRFGMERMYPRQRIATRLGYFKDPVSSRKLLTFGGGWFSKSFNVNAAFLTRKFPAVLDSQSLGVAFSGAVLF